jgi:hypothetical protein
MGRTLMIVGLLMLLVLGLSAAGAALMFWALDLNAFEEAVNIRIDGHPWGLGDPGAERWLLGLLGVGIAMLVMLIVVPLAIVLALAGTIFGLAMGLLGLLLAAGVVFSPLIIIGGVLWLALRNRRASAPAPGAGPQPPA